MFGQSLRLQPLSTEKKDLWKREMNCFMSICDYIVEVIPRSLGNNVEVKDYLTCCSRYLNALKV